MNTVDVFEQMAAIEQPSQFDSPHTATTEHMRKVQEHRSWMRSIRHERPNPAKHFKIGVYIRFFNQTKYSDYLENHKLHFAETLALCPNWELVDFYIDYGSTAPNMECASEWERLLDDCAEGKVDLIITQKISNVSKKTHEITICARLLAQQTPPIGIYFISEDIYTLASYYLDDMRDEYFSPPMDQATLPDATPEEVRLLSND